MCVRSLQTLTILTLIFLILTNFSRIPSSSFNVICRQKVTRQPLFVAWKLLDQNSSHDFYSFKFTFIIILILLVLILISYEVCCKNFPLSYGIAQVIITSMHFLYICCSYFPHAHSIGLKFCKSVVKKFVFVTVISFRIIII